MALAVLLCDDILNSGGKNSLIGIFDKVNCPTFPVVHPRLWVYAEIGRRLRLL